MSTLYVHTICPHIVPCSTQVEDGTQASTAILLFVRQPRVLSKLLGNMRTKMEKLANRTHLLARLGTIHAWVRQDPQLKVQKLELIRNLGGNLENDLEQETAYRIVEYLVSVAAGRSPDDDNKRGYYPFGEKAGTSTEHFKNCSFTWFAHVLTAAYPFIRADRDKWGLERAKKAHPLNATGLWLLFTIKRYQKFFKLFRSRLAILFESYEEQDGDYFGAEPAPVIKVSTGGERSCKRSLTMADVEAMSDEDEDSMDREFV